MFKHKCKDCGKVYENKPEKCTCEGESGFSEIEVVVEKETVDIEKIKSDLKKEFEEQLKTETNKIQNDYLEKLKNNKPSSTEDKKEEDGTETQIALSRMQAQIDELTNINKALNTEIQSEKASKKEALIKAEIIERIDKEPYLKDTVMKYLNNGTIKTIEDYDSIVSPLKATLKEAWERKEQDKETGKDPRRDYSNDKPKQQSKDWKKEAKEAHQAEINKLLGIRQ